jgi:hypothetical protein
MLYVAFFLVYGVAFAFTVFLIRYLWVERSFRKSLYYCMRYKWSIASFALGYTLLFVVLEMAFSTSYIYYILPGVSVPAAFLIAKGIVPSFRQ